jgi:hypothetical protein
MSDKLQQLEAELAAMRPRALSPALVERIESELAAAPVKTSSWPDRFLLSAIGSGAIAACVILAMLLKPASNAFPSPPLTVANTAAWDPPRAGDYSLVVVARADGGMTFGP